MTAPDLTTTSKYLSLILRHNPQSIGLDLDSRGWARIEDVIAKSAIPLTRAMITQVVASSDKQRFAISGDGAKIRANQGHSLAVDLGLPLAMPPETLFHGTAARHLDAILSQGLRKGTRQHVHLSANVETATKVGQRHGVPAVLSVAAGQAMRDGHPFWISDNGVWLTIDLPAKYLRVHV